MATILVVDDHAAGRQYLAKLLGYRGHAVHEASDGRAALDAARAAHPDLIITDVVMPVMDGYRLVKELRGDPELAAVPVVFYTATFNQAQARALAETCGVTQILTKPSRPQVLLDAIDGVLGTAAHPTPAHPPADFDREHLRLLGDTLTVKVDELELLGRRQTALLELSRRLTLETNPAHILNAACESTLDMFDGRTAGFARSAHELEPDSTVELRNAVREVVERRCPFWASSPSAERPVLAVPVALPDKFFGVLYVARPPHSVFDERDAQIAITLANQIAVAYQNAVRQEDIRTHARQLEEEIAERTRTEQALRRSETELSRHAVLLHTLSGRLMEAQETERRHIAQELHDQVGQNLTVLRILLHSVRGAVAADTAEAGALDESVALVRRLVDQICHLSLDLRPSLLDVAGLAPALRWYLDRLSTQTGLAIRLAVHTEEARFLPGLEVTCFRIVQEALTNVLRHARATSAEVALTFTPGAVEFVVRDDGVGFDVAAVRERAPRDSLGLVGMEERVRAVGGTFEVTSAPARGTRVSVRIPLPESRDVGEPK